MTRRGVPGLFMVAAVLVGALACTATTSSPTTQGAPGTAGVSTGVSTRRSTPGSTPGTTAGTAPMTIDHPVTAAQYRTALTLAMDKRILLLAAASNAAAGGRDDEASAAARAAGEANADVTSLINGSPRSATTTDDSLVDYLIGWAKLSTKGQTPATRAEPDLPTGLGFTAEQRQALQAMVAAQISGDQPAAFDALVTALDGVGDAAGPVVQKADAHDFPGDAFSKAADLDTGLNSLLAEHVALAAMATNAALGGRTAEFEAAKSALDGNTQTLADAIGTVFGKQAGDGFFTSWTKHIGFFVDYTNGVAGDPAKKAQAAKDLTAYADELARFFNAALPDVPRQSLHDLILGHLTGLESVIDAQGAKDWSAAFTRLPDGMDHMAEIGVPLAAAIVASMPAKFPT